jgi:hypothetical protein
VAINNTNNNNSTNSTHITEKIAADTSIIKDISSNTHHLPSNMTNHMTTITPGAPEVVELINHLVIVIKVVSIVTSKMMKIIITHRHNTLTNRGLKEVVVRDITHKDKVTTTNLSSISVEENLLLVKWKCYLGQ